MEVQEDGTLPARVVYITREDNPNENDVTLQQETPVYIVPDMRVDGEPVGDNNDAFDTEPSSPVSSIHSDATTVDNTDDNEIDSNGATANNPSAITLPTTENDNKKPCLNRKRLHSDDEESSNKDDVDEDNEGTLCPICLDNWTNAGPHRLCCLKCGHLFGLSCVQRWLDTQRRKTCPTCKKHVSRNDIRPIYARKVISVDTQVVETLKKQLDDTNNEKLQLQIELNKSQCKECALRQEVHNLRMQISEMKSLKSNDLYQQPKASCSKKVKLYKDKSLEVSFGCRVFDVNTNLNIIAVSSKSTSNLLFAGFGIRKVSIPNYKITTFIPLHLGPIRDIAFHPHNNGLLTASLDKSCKFVDFTTNSPTVTIGCGTELWSCCWDRSNSNIFYVGTRQGSIFKYDIRWPCRHVCTYDVPNDMSPVVSVASLAKENTTDTSLVSCKLSSLWLFNNDNNISVPVKLPIEGPFISMRSEPLTKQVLVSSRPNPNFPHTRHTLFNVTKDTQCNIVHTFSVDSKPNFLSRSCFVTKENDYIAAHSEKDRCVMLWSINTGNKETSIPAYDPVLDLCSFKFNEENVLASLTEKKLDFFKFTTDGI